MHSTTLPTGLNPRTVGTIGIIATSHTIVSNHLKSSILHTPRGAEVTTNTRIVSSDVTATFHPDVATKVWDRECSPMAFTAISSSSLDLMQS